jgi:flagellar biosynthesis GTPase FlhF
MTDDGTKTFRGSSLEEILPQIREQLGPDAVITRQREGIVGGIGGFFGKKTVEVEARPGSRPAAVPRRRVVDAYDTGEPRSERPAPLPAPAPARALPPGEDVAEERDLLEELFAQSSPFADELALALQDEADPPVDEPQPVVEQAPPVVQAAPVVEQAPADGEDVWAVAEPLTVAVPTSSEPAAIRGALERASIPATLAADLVEEAELRLLPFAPDRSLTEHARRALAHRIRVDHGTRGKRRIALIGAPRSGRTLAAAKLCGVYSRSNRSVCAVSLEPPADAFGLGAVTRPFGVALEVAHTPKKLEALRRRLATYDVVVADTPALDPADPASLRRLQTLLAALKPNEIHIVLPATESFDALRRTLLDAKSELKVRSCVITHADESLGGGATVGLSLAERLPVSYLSSSPLAASGIRAAEPDDLARMVLP